MLPYSFEHLNNQLNFFNSIKEDYLYNFSWTLGRPLIGPQTLLLIVTTKCNLTCLMCSTWKLREEEIDGFYFKKIIDDTYKMGNLKEVIFTGGEALLHPGIFNLIKYVKDYYLGCCTILNTNGVLLTKKAIDRLIDISLDNLSISIDSPLMAIHDALRGKGVFEKVVEAIDYLNAEKKRRMLEYPRLVTCSVLMEQTLDTMYDMINFCFKHNISNIVIQPYAPNVEMAIACKDDRFLIHKERLPVLRDVLNRIEAKKEEVPNLHIELPLEKIYKYFSEPMYVDKCYAGFMQALLIGKKIQFICSGQNNKEEYKYLGFADKDSIDELWFSEKANHVRESIKACNRNCVQFCSIRPSSDSVLEIHQRLVDQRSLFLLFRELHFLEEYITKYPSLPIKGIIELDYQCINENSKALLSSIERLKSESYSKEAKECLLSDLKVLDTLFPSGTANTW